MKTKKIILFVILTFALTACGNKDNSSSEESSYTAIDIKYAKGFKIKDFENFKQLTVFNPWGKRGEVLCQYYLVKNKDEKVPNNGTKVVVPLRSLASASCTHYEFIALLNEISSLKAVCNPELAYNKDIRNAIATKKIHSIGDSFNPNIERLMALQPDGYMLPSYNQNDNTKSTLQQTGITLIYNNEWVEETVLGRAEWIKFVAAFFDKQDKADSIFNEIETNYNKVVDLAKNVKEKPAVMCGNNFKGTWYMPSGRSYMGKLFIDAGADYRYESDTTTGSLPLSFEEVLLNFQDCDIWLNAPTDNIAELKAMDARHGDFRPLQENNVYAFLARTDGGANDFWESAVAHPDLVLKDLVWALHPTLLPDYEPTYILKLK